jgi:hypothetical protein
MTGKVCPECDQLDMLDYARPKAEMAQELGKVTLLTLGVSQFNAWEVPDDEGDES